MSQVCTALRHGKTPCTNESKQMHLGIIPLCTSHLASVQANLRTERHKSYRKGFAFFIDGKVKEHQKKLERPGEVVYFIRAGKRVKIGRSMNPEKRLASIKGGHGCTIPMNLDTGLARIVATEPGGRERERELHNQFAHLRNVGEWFWGAPDLTSYIKSIAA